MEARTSEIREELRIAQRVDPTIRADSDPLGGATSIYAATTNRLADSMDQWRREDRIMELKIILDQEGRVQGASTTGDVGVNLQQ